MKEYLGGLIECGFLIRIAETHKKAIKSTYITNKNFSPRFGGLPFTWYKESGHIEYYTRTSARTRISNYVYNRTSNPATLTVTGSYTKGAEANDSLSSGDISAIKQEIGLSYNSSYTFTQEIQFLISSNHKGWMDFTPIMYNSYGYIQNGVTSDIKPFYIITSETWTDVYFPKELPNGQLDGIYELMEAPI